MSPFLQTTIVACRGIFRAFLSQRLAGEFPCEDLEQFTRDSNRTGPVSMSDSERSGRTLPSMSACQAATGRLPRLPDVLAGLQPDSRKHSTA